MNITILPEAALDDAKNIEKIVAEIASSLEKLDKTIRDNIPEHLETEWSTRLLENWDKYYNNDIKGAMAGMIASSVNLKSAVDMALNYSEQ